MLLLDEVFAFHHLLTSYFKPGSVLPVLKIYNVQDYTFKCTMALTSQFFIDQNIQVSHHHSEGLVLSV